MPEADTVHRTAVRLHQALAGSRVIAGEFRWPNLAVNDPARWRTVEVVSRGKHLLHRFDNGLTLHSHLRMEGHWQVRATVGPPARPRGRRQELRVWLRTAEAEAFGWRLGTLDLIRTDAEQRLVGHLGPDVLGTDWDAERAATNILAAPATIGEALLDQRNLAGIGTMWASDLLFLTGINPWRPAREVDPAQLAALLDRAVTAITRAAAGTISTSTGSTRRGEETWVHARSGRPCRRCGGVVRVALIGRAPTARTMFYCPHCQGGLAPNDNGRPQAPLGARRDTSGRRR